MTKFNIDISRIPTPCYLVDEGLLERNMKILQGVSDRTGCKILLAQKAFSMFSMYPMMSNYLAGTTASSLYEARLGKEEFGGETHIFAPAYKDSEMDEILKLCDHIVFNSWSQWRRFQDKVEKVRGFGKKLECGIRINPEYAEIETDIYNPCVTGSRLGMVLSDFEKEGDFQGIDGLHFHTMCEQNSDTLERTLHVVEDKFGKYFSQMKWINFGGGHHITRADYDIARLERCIAYIQNTYQVQVYLEPGEAAALHTGYLVTEVLELGRNGCNLAILDTSAACHMPDVLEMPYRPEIIGAGKPKEKPYTYRLGGPTCLAGDVIGDYSFDQPLKVGDKLVFTDMSIYTMVKNNTFNGIKLPAILTHTKQGETKMIREFGYEDFKNRLS